MRIAKLSLTALAFGAFSVVAPSCSSIPSSGSNAAGASTTVNLPTVVMTDEYEQLTSIAALSARAHLVVVAHVGPVIRTESQRLESPKDTAHDATAEDLRVNAIQQAHVSKGIPRSNISAGIEPEGNIKVVVAYMNPDSDLVRRSKVSIQGDVAQRTGPLPEGDYLLFLTGASYDGPHGGMWFLTDRFTGALSLDGTGRVANSGTDADGKSVPELEPMIASQLVDQDAVTAININARRGG